MEPERPASPQAVVGDKPDEAPEKRDPDESLARDDLPEDERIEQQNDVA